MNLALSRNHAIANDLCVRYTPGKVVTHAVQGGSRRVVLTLP
jgi:hypothetical protein